MQLTIKSHRIIQEGTQAKSGQPYKWVSVMADDGSPEGTEYTTFDTGVLKLGPGSIIEIGDPVTKGGKLSFKKLVSVVSEVKASEIPTESGPAAAPAGGGYKRDVEGIRFEYQCKAQIIKGERASIEAQTAYKGIIELATSLTMDESTDETRKAYEEAIAWARVKMAANLSTQGSPEPAGAPPAPSIPDAPVETGVSPPYVEPDESFPHIGALLAWCKNYGIDRPTFLTIVKCEEKAVKELDVDKTFALIKAYLIERAGAQAEAQIFGKPE